MATVKHLRISIDGKKELPIDSFSYKISENHHLKSKFAVTVSDVEDVTGLLDAHFHRMKVLTLNLTIMDLRYIVENIQEKTIIGWCQVWEDEEKLEGTGGLAVGG